MDKVLLVEDDRTMLSLLHTLLSFEGYAAIPLELQDDLDEIMKFLHHEKPALILLDVNLRRFSGFDLLSRLRQEPELSSIRVIMASGIDFRDRSLREGADSFILKPFMFDELLGEIKRILDRPNSVPDN